MLKEFGEALAHERAERGFSLANLSKSMGGVSKGDIKNWESGQVAPRSLELKQLVACFPKLKAFEEPLKKLEHSEVRLKVAKPVAAPREAPVRLAPPPPPPPLPRPARVQPLAYRKPVEIINPVGPEPLKFQPFTPKALSKTRGEMLTDLGKIVMKRLGALTSDEFDFTIKNDGKHLTIKLQLAEGEEDFVESGCYVAVGPREPCGLGVFTKTMTSGNYSTTQARSLGVIELLQLAQVLHDAVKDRRFE